MSVGINNKSTVDMINRHLRKAQEENSDALEKMASGTVFTKQDPRPAERALSERLDLKLRSLTSSKRNMSDAVTLLQTAESGLEEINNLILRMKEISLSAANTIINDKDRSYLFIEYKALSDEVNRVAESTTFNGLKLLNGDDDSVPEQLVFRMGDPQKSELADNDDNDINLLRFDGFKKVVATAGGLGLPDVSGFLENLEDGVSIDDVIDLIRPSDDESFPTVFDEALHTLTLQRSIYGGFQSRLQKASDYLDVYQENISAAHSNISDVDFAEQIARATRSKLLMSAATSMLTQTDFQAEMTHRLLDRL